MCLYLRINEAAISCASDKTGSFDESMNLFHLDTVRQFKYIFKYADLMDNFVLSLNHSYLN
jgi:hypothetical protein